MDISLNIRKHWQTSGCKIMDDHSVKLCLKSRTNKITPGVEKNGGERGRTWANVEGIHCMKFHFLRAIHQGAFV